MIKQLKIENNDQELVTKDFLRVEIGRLINERIDPLEKRLDSFENNMNKRFSSFESNMNKKFSSFEKNTNERFNSFEKNINERFEKFGEIILAKFDVMETNHRELMQRCDSLDRNDIHQEIEHDKLEKRVFHLEIAK